MLKKVITSILALSLILGICLNVNAAELKTKLEVTKQASETKNLENNKGYISKTIVDSNAEKGEVTIEVKVDNSNSDENGKIKYAKTEIYLIAEIRGSDNEKITTINQYLKTLSEKILNYSDNVKIGIIGLWGPLVNTELGTENDAKVLLEATSDINEIKECIDNMYDDTKHYNNLQVSLKEARSLFSDEVNKIIINSFTTVPYSAVGEKASWNGGEDSCRALLDRLVSKTKSEMLMLKNENIELISIRPNNLDYTIDTYDLDTGEYRYSIDGEPYANELYGTIENPTYGKMYAMDEDNLDRIITEYMYQDVISTIGSSITNTKIVDYFPKDITDNFEFSYVGTPSVGTVSDEIDKTTNTITWNIGTLDANKVATLKYKLKIKDMKNKDLLEKEIATNEKIILTYKDVESNDYTVNLSSSPKIKLTEVKEAEVSKKDETTAQNKIPQTGVSMTIVGAIVIVLGVSGFTFIMFRKYKEIK